MLKEIYDHEEQQQSTGNSSKSSPSQRRQEYKQKVQNKTSTISKFKF